MDPRQQIATVAYALNSETLQGLGLGTSGIGYKNTVAVFDNSGNLNLGETSPTIKSVSGTFGIEGQAMLLKASDGSGGNITINPDAGGILDLSFEMNAPAVGGFVQAEADANMVSGNLYSGIVRSNYSNNYNFLQFQNYDLGVGNTQLNTRFSVGASGNVYIGGALTLSNSTIVGAGTTALFIDPSTNIITRRVLGSLAFSDTAIGTTYSTTNGLSAISTNVFGLGGALTQNTRLNIGNTEVMYFDYATGRVGLGTTNPTTKIEVSGAITINGVAASGTYQYLKVGSTALSYWGSDAGFDSGTATNALIGVAGNNKFSLYTNATRRLTIDGSGNVGIGTTLPLYTLDVNGAGNFTKLGIGGTHATALLNVAGDGNFTGAVTINANGLPAFTVGGSNSGGNNGMTIQNTSNTANSNAGIIIKTAGGLAGDPSIYFDTTQGANAWTIGADNSNSGAFTFSNNTGALGTNDRVTITNIGNVGIGTTNPTYRLQVGGTGSLGVGGTVNFSGLGLGSTGTGTTAVFTDASGNLYKNILGALAFGSAYTFNNGLTETSRTVGLGGTLNQLTKIDLNGNNFGFFGTGNFGLGTTSPTNKLDIINDTTYTGNSTVNNNDLSVLRNLTANITGGSATITADANSSIGVSNTTNLNFNHTVGNNSNNILIVGVNYQNSLTRTVSGIYWNGTPLTKATTASGTQTWADIWYLVAPTPGTYSIGITMSGQAASLVAGAASFYNVNQITPIGVATTASGMNTNLSIGTSSNASEIVFSTLSVNNVRTVTLGAGQTSLWNQGINQVTGVASYQIGAANTSSSYTINTLSIWAGATVSLQPATGGSLSILNPLVNFSSKCTESSGSCSDTANILNLSQLYTKATGTVFSIGSSGSGNLASLVSSNSSGNGLNLDIGSTSSSNYSLKITSGSGANTNLYIQANGSVGIGNTSPAYKLDVTGSGRFTTNLDVGGTLAVTGRSTFAQNLFVNAGGIGVTGNSSFTNNVGIGGTLTLSASTVAGSGTTALFIDSNNVVSKRALGALAFLDSTASTYNWIAKASSNQTISGGTTLSFTGLNGITSTSVGTSQITFGLGGTLTQNTFINTGTNNLYIMGVNNNTQALAITTAGNVGIGTTAPLYPLQVAGAGVFTKLGVGGTSTASIYTNADLSVGTTTTTASLNLSNTAIGGSSVAAFLSGNSGLIGYLDTSSWDKSGSDDRWFLQATGAGSTAIGVGVTVNFANGTNILNTISGSTVTIGTTNAPTFSASVFSPIFSNNGSALTLGHASGLTTILGSGITLTPNTSFTANVGIGGTLTLSASTVAGTGTTALFIDSNNVVSRRALGGLAFQDNTYISWMLAGNTGTAQQVGIGNTASILGYNGIGTSVSGTDQLSIGLGGTLTQNTFINTGANNLYIMGVNNNTQALAITTNGNVGIGTTSPYATFDIGGLITTPILSGSVPKVLISDNVDGISGVQMKNTSTGTNADFRFMVGDTTGQYLAFMVPGVNNNVASILGAARNANDFIINNPNGGTGRGLVIGTYGTNDVILGTNNTANVTIKSGGNVGIGTTAPLYPLQVAGAGVFTKLGVGGTDTNALYVSGNGNLTGNLSIGGTLAVTGRSTFAQNLFVNAGGIGVTGNSSFTNNVGIGGTLTLSASTVSGTGTTALFIDSNNVVSRRALNGLAFDGLLNLQAGTSMVVTGTGVGATISHADTSSQASSDNSNGIVIQDIGLDGLGHLTSLATVDLDSRYAQSANVSWMLAGSLGTAQSIGLGNTASFLAGSGIGTSISGTDALTITNTGVLSLTGTANQILANGTTATAQTGAVTLTLPQNIHTGATPLFAGLTISSGGIGVSGASVFGNTLSIGNTLTLTNVTANTLVRTNATNQLIGTSGTVNQLMHGDLSWGDVTLGTQTAGNYVSTIIGNSQIGVTGTAGEGVGVSLAIIGDSIGDSQLAFNTGQHLTTSSTPLFAGLTISAGGIGVSGASVFGNSLSVGTTLTTASLSVTGNGSVTGTLSVGNTLTATTAAKSPLFMGNGATVTFGNASYLTTIAGLGLTITPNTSFTANVGIGGTLTLSASTVAGTGTTALFIDSNNVVSKRALGGLAFQDNTYISWMLAGNTGTAQQVGIGNTASILGYNGIGTSVSGTDQLSIGLGGTLTQNTFINTGANNLYIMGVNNNTQALAITTNGNVGIGMTNPTSPFNVYSNSVTQATFNGWDPIGGAQAYNGSVAIGNNAAYQGLIHYNGNGVANLYIDNTYNSAVLGGIFFRTRTAGTPVDAMSILSAGNVGIGTTAPLYKFQVAGEGVFTKLGVGATHSTYSLFINSGGIGITGTSSFSANVGIGGTLTLSASTVAGTGTTALFIDSNNVVSKRALNGLAFDGLLNLQAGTSMVVTGTGVGATISHADTSSQASSDNSNGIVIQDIGLDGLGHLTSLATVDLDNRYAQSANVSWMLAGSLGTAQSIGLGNTASILGYNGIGTSISGTDQLSIGLGGTLTQNTNINLSSYNLSFLGTGNTQSLYLKANGNVGIGTTGPRVNLDIVGTSGVMIDNVASGNALLYLQGKSTNNSVINFRSNTSTSWSIGRDGSDSHKFKIGYGSETFASGVALVIDATGKVGIATTTPSYTLQVGGTGSLGVGGTVNFSGLGIGTTGVGTTAVFIDSSGNLYKNVLGAGAFTSGAGTLYTAGVGISLSSTNVFSNIGVTSILGTTNQITASNPTGAVTLSLPQNIHTGATPLFAGLTISSGGIGVSGASVFGNTLSIGNTLTLTNVTANTLVRTNATNQLIGTSGTVNQLMHGDLSWGDVTLGTQTTGNYATSNAEGGPALSLYGEDNRSIGPTEVNTSNLKFGFTAYNNNSAGPWADFLHLNSYLDGSGGNQNLLEFNKSSLGMRLYQGSFGSTAAYTTYKDIALVDNNPISGYLTKFTGTTATVSITNSLIYDSGTNIGLGTTNPLYKLHVTGEGVFTKLGVGGTSTASIYTNADLSVGTTTTTASLNLSNTAIGGSSVAAFLSGNSGLVGYLDTTAWDKNGANDFIAATNGLQSIGTSSVGLGGTLTQNTNIGVSSFGLSFLGINSNTQALYIASSGNVGFGTTAPSQKVDISGNLNLSGHLVGGDGTNAPANLINNGNFDYWNIGTSSIPDAWISNGGTFSRDTGYKSTYSLKMVDGGAWQGAKYTVPPRSTLTTARKYTLNFWYKSSSTNTLPLQLGVYDGTSYIVAYGNQTLIKDDAWHWQSTNFTIGDDKTISIFMLTNTGTSHAGDTDWIDSVSLYEGDQANAFSTNYNDYLKYGSVSMFGPLGIGATNSSYKLNVSGSANITTNLTIGGTFVSVGSTNTVTNLSADLLDGQHGSYYLNIGNTGDFVQNQFTADQTANLRINGNAMFGGNVGIGATSTAKLNVIGNGNFTTNLSIGGTLSVGSSATISANGIITGTKFVDIGNTAYYFNTSNSTSISDSSLSLYQSGSIRFNAVAVGSTLRHIVSNAATQIRGYSNGLLLASSTSTTGDITGWDNQLFLNSTGNVGIGTTAPLYKLHVNGDALISTRLGIGSTNALYLLNVGGTASFTNLHASGNVGIGTTAPTSSLHLYSTTGSANNPQLTLTSSPSSPGRYSPSIVFQNNDGSSAGWIGSASRITGGFERGSSWVNSALGFDVGNASAGLSRAMTITNYGNVGIGTTNPLYKLEVNGDALISTRLGIGSTNALYLLNVGGTASFTNLYTTGNVGVGTTAPGYTLDVNGIIKSNNTIYSLTTAGTTPKFILVETGRSTWTLSQPTTTSAFHIDQDGNSRLFIQNSTGNVGIGITNPTYKLQVVGNGYLSTSLSVGSSLIVAGGDIKQGGTDDLRLWAGSGNDFYFYKSDGSVSARIDVSTAAGAETLDQGFTGPNNSFAVYGTRLFSQSFTPQASGSLSKVTLQLWKVGAGSYNFSVQLQNCDGNQPNGTVVATSSNIANTSIGETASPGAEYSLTFSTKPYLQAGTKYCLVTTTSTGGDGSNYINVREKDSSSTYTGGQAGYYNGSVWDTASYTAVDMYFKQYYQNNYGSVLHIGSVDTANADLAENYPSTQNLSTGELVTFDLENTGHVLRAQAGSQKLVGVVSTNPGLLLGSSETSQNVYPIALSGRVPVKITLENGAISPGDPLTASTTIEGRAQKATTSGPIIGKALESSSSCSDPGNCTILALVQPSWFDPDTLLTLDTLGQIVTSPETNIQDPGSKIYHLTSSNGSAVTRLGQFSQALIANLKAGIINTSKLVSNDIETQTITPISNTGIGSTLKIGGDTEVIGSLFAQNIKTPSLNVDHLDSLTSNIQDLKSKTITAQDIGVTTLSANAITALTSNIQDLRSKDATISGILYADQIISREGNFGDLMTQKISALRDEVKKIIDTSTVTTPPEDVLLSQSENWLADISTGSAQITGSLALTDNLVVAGQLAVAGQAELADALISGTLQSGQIIIKDNLIETTASVLYIQPSKVGTINIMNNTLIIADNGDVTVNGNIYLNGTLTAQTATISGSLSTYLITASDIQTTSLTALTSNIQDLRSNKLTILPNVAIAQADPSESATQSAEIASNTTAGTTTLIAGQTEIIILNNQLTSASMVYLTPVGSTNNQVIYIKDKYIDPTSNIQDLKSSFTIAIDNPLDHNIDINWWIIN